MTLVTPQRVLLAGTQGSIYEALQALPASGRSGALILTGLFLPCQSLRASLPFPKPGM